MLVEEWHVAHFFWGDASKDGTNILVVSASFVKSVVLFFIQFGSSRKVAVVSWLLKADALHVALL